MVRIIVVRRRGWHCAFTKACVFEHLGPGFKIPGTNLTFCGSHVQVAQMMSHSGGRDSAENQASMNLVPRRTGAA